ncbi:MAG: sulfite exporter TauE/SafE family protein [Caulobacter sp.]|jgi:uncharacterized membrane protein YfcA|nr:sulfite exporter TauE/SafE family protein [Caulobacter sp.]
MSAEFWALGAAAAGGAIIGLLLAVFGGGGSVLATPLLLYVAGMKDPHVAIGTSAAAVSVNALAGLAMQARAGRVKWPCATVFAVSGLAGALTGAAIAKRIDGTVLMVWFAIAMAAVALSMMWPRRTDGDPHVRLNRAMTLKLAPVGAATGLAAGFFGIGGGFLIAPGLMAASGMTLANAAASSLISVALFGAATSISYAASGMVDIPMLVALVAGGIVGTVVGAPVARRLAAQASLARSLFGGLILATAAWIAWRSLTA